MRVQLNFSLNLDLYVPRDVLRRINARNVGTPTREYDFTVIQYVAVKPCDIEAEDMKCAFAKSSVSENEDRSLEITGSRLSHRRIRRLDVAGENFLPSRSARSRAYVDNEASGVPIACVILISTLVPRKTLVTLIPKRSTYFWHHQRRNVTIKIQEIIFYYNLKYKKLLQVLL